MKKWNIALICQKHEEDKSTILEIFARSGKKAVVKALDEAGKCYACKRDWNHIMIMDDRDIEDLINEK